MNKKLNGVVPVPPVLASPGAALRSTSLRSASLRAAPGEAKTAPDPEVVVKAHRRQFTADYKKRVLAEADSPGEPGVIGAMLRREGLYSSHLTNWRMQRDQGLAPHRRGPKPKHDPLFEQVCSLKQQNGQLTQRLAQAELIIEVQKKVSLLLGIPLAAAGSGGSNS